MRVGELREMLTGLDPSADVIVMDDDDDDVMMEVIDFDTILLDGKEVAVIVSSRWESDDV